MPDTKVGSGDWADAAAREFAASAHGVGLKVPTALVAKVFRQIETVDIDLSGMERVYSTDLACQFFNRSPQWLYWAMNPRDENGGGLFYDEGGNLIEPEMVGVKNIRRFSLEVIRQMGASWYRMGGIDLPGLEEIIRKTKLAAIGQWAPDPDKKPPKRKRKKKVDTHNGSKPQGTD